MQAQVLLLCLSEATLGSGAARTLTRTRTRTRALALALALTCACRRPRRRSRSCRHPAWCAACTAGAARGSGECHGPAAARAATHPSPNPSLSLALTLAGVRGRAPSCRRSGPPRLAGLRCASRAGPCSTACSERAAARSKGTLGGVLKRLVPVFEEQLCLRHPAHGGRHHGRRMQSRRCLSYRRL